MENNNNLYNKASMIPKYLTLVQSKVGIHKYPYRTCSYKMGSNLKIQEPKTTQYYYTCCHCQANYCIEHLLLHFQLISSIVHSWDSTHKVITIFNTKTRKKTKKQIKAYKETIDCLDSISVGSRIFIIGGFLLGIMYEVDLIKKALMKKEQMKRHKCSQSLCHFNSYIYSIGGWEEVSIDDCEKYDISKDQWHLLPPLLIARSNCAAFIFYNCVFAFCGQGKNCEAINSMERLKLRSCDKWESVKVNRNISERFNIHGIGIHDGVIVFGSE